MKVKTRFGEKNVKEENYQVFIECRVSGVFSDELNIQQFSEKQQEKIALMRIGEEVEMWNGLQLHCIERICARCQSDNQARYSFFLGTHDKVMCAQCRTKAIKEHNTFCYVDMSGEEPIQMTEWGHAELGLQKYGLVKIYRLDDYEFFNFKNWDEMKKAF